MCNTAENKRDTRKCCRRNIPFETFCIICQVIIDKEQEEERENIVANKQKEGDKSGTNNPVCIPEPQSVNKI